MNIRDRVEAFRCAFPTNRAAWPAMAQEQGRDVLYATWLPGADYRNKAQFYGAYPPTYLTRIMALYPDATAADTLHAFSGSLPPGPYLRCDLKQPAEFACSVYDLPAVVIPGRFGLVLADPPYSAVDAEKYGTPPLNRGRALRALADVTMPGGHLVWLDVVWPMHRKDQWLTVGRITIVRSTNHRVRMATIFERVS